MEEMNLIVVVASAFAAVLILLSLLAGLMYLLSYLFPERAEPKAEPVVAAGVTAAESELARAAGEADERERAAVIAAVLLTLEAEASVQSESSLPEAPGRNWKLMGRLERMDDASSARGWKRLP